MIGRLYKGLALLNNSLKHTKKIRVSRVKLYFIACAIVIFCNYLILF